MTDGKGSDLVLRLRASRAHDGVDLVDEDRRWCMVPGELEEHADQLFGIA